MSLIIVGGISVVASGLLAAWFWNYVVSFFQNHCIPFVRRRFGEGVADALASVMGFIDDGVVAVRRFGNWTKDKVVQGWQWFQTHVLRLETKYSKNVDGTYTGTTKVETITDVSEDSVVVEETTSTRTLKREDLPSDFRRKLMQYNQTEATYDDKETIKDKFAKRASEEGLEMEI